MTTSVITAWETYSPLGHGAQAHADGLRSDPEAHRVRHAVEDFDIREILGRRGTRAMDRAAGLAVATTGKLLSTIGSSGAAPYAPDELGLVLGTSDGVQSAMDFLRDTWTRDRPYDVDPAHVPRTLMNFGAGQCAIRHGIKGPNTTICGSHATGLLTLNYARRLHRNGHAKAVVWGAVEELSDDRAAVAAARADGHTPSEGCVMFLLSAPGEGGRTLAEVLAVEFAVDTGQDGGIRHALGACLRGALRRTGVSADEVCAAVPSPSPSRDAQERAAVADVLPDVPLLSRTADTLGDTGAVSAAFQLVELFTTARHAPGQVGVVTTSDAEGRVGCALLRLH